MENWGRMGDLGKIPVSDLVSEEEKRFGEKNIRGRMGDLGKLRRKNPFLGKKRFGGGGNGRFGGKMEMSEGNIQILGSELNALESRRVRDIPTSNTCGSLQ